MSRQSFYDKVDASLDQIRADGLWKHERTISSPQGGSVITEDAGAVLNLCANNYLGLADHPDIIAAANASMTTHGFGMASVRFI